MKFLSNRNNKMLKARNKVNTEKRLFELSSLAKEELFVRINSSVLGLTDRQVDERQEEYGLNIITSGTSSTAFTRLKEAVINPFNIVLFAIIIITILTDIFFEISADWATVIIMFLLISISSGIAFFQGERSNNAASELSKMIINKADVIRNNVPKEISIDELVVGDVVKLSAGDMIPADVYFTSTKDTFVAQASLTGESNPVEKFSDNKIKSSAITDAANIGFMGSNIVSGSAMAVVIATGNDTYIGSMATSISNERAKNSFERGVDSVSKLLIRLMLIMLPVIFIINGITKNDWIGALLFAITISVGLTPEMLPVIMTSTLARGAISMSKHKVIVKSLGAIQTFGEMDVLCTDKTGTLTEDKIVLERYLNVNGVDDERVLKYGYLNSFYQTGLKNLIDLAIINRANSNGIDSILSEYVCIDEIPFDFSRRRMSVVLKDTTGNIRLITKGAVEEIVSLCKYVEIEGKITEFTSSAREKAMKVYEKHNNDGLRMIAVAKKNEQFDTRTFNVDDENELVLVGFIGFLDPPKESAKNAIEALTANGVRVIVLTGDSEGVAKKVCSKVSVDTSICISGSDVANMTDQELSKAVEESSLFAKLSPVQKERVVKMLQANGHTVGYMGDGINDALPLHQADVGISVDTAVDIAKETAHIILLKKDLMVLEEGVIEGRKTFGNISKYIKMATSGNFGNMISVIIASIFLPFLPMLPIQILTQNLLNDFAQMGIPFDSLDSEYITVPRKWETDSIKMFMFFMGPISTLFDMLCFIVLWWIMKANSIDDAMIFHCGWFIFGTLSQIAVIHMIRSAKMPFIQSNASTPLYISTALVSLVVLGIGFSHFADFLSLTPMPFSFVPWLVILVVGYCIACQIAKIIYIKKYNSWL